MLLGIFADYKKCGVNLTRGEQVEQLRRELFAWTVIEGHGDERALHVDRAVAEGGSRGGRGRGSGRLGRGLLAENEDQGGDLRDSPESDERQFHGKEIALY